MSSVATVNANGMERVPTPAGQGGSPGASPARTAARSGLPQAPEASNEVGGRKGEGGRDAGLSQRAAARGDEARRGPDAGKGRDQEREQEPSVVEEQLEQLRNQLGVKLNFQLDRELDRMIVKVVNPQTDEVIRQVPPEEMVALAKQLREQQGEETTGVLMDEFR